MRAFFVKTILFFIKINKFYSRIQQFLKKLNLYFNGFLLTARFFLGIRGDQLIFIGRAILEIWKIVAAHTNLRNKKRQKIIRNFI